LKRKNVYQPTAVVKKETKKPYKYYADNFRREEEAVAPPKPSGSGARVRQGSSQKLEASGSKSGLSDPDPHSNNPSRGA